MATNPHLVQRHNITNLSMPLQPVPSARLVMVMSLDDKVRVRGHGGGRPATSSFLADTLDYYEDIFTAQNVMPACAPRIFRTRFCLRLGELYAGKSGSGQVFWGAPMDGRSSVTTSTRPRENWSSRVRPGKLLSRTKSSSRHILRIWSGQQSA